MRWYWPIGSCCAPPNPRKERKKTGSIRLDEMICDSSMIYWIVIQGRLHKKGLRSQRIIENGEEELELDRGES